MATRFNSHAGRSPISGSLDKSAIFAYPEQTQHISTVRVPFTTRPWRTSVWQLFVVSLSH